MSEKPCVLVMSTCQSNLQSLLKLRELLENHGVNVLLVSVDKIDTKHAKIDLKTSEVRFQHLKFKEDLKTLSTEDFNSNMTECCASLLQGLQTTKRINGVLSYGRNANRLLLDAILQHQALPIGFPKLIVAEESSLARLVENGTDIVLIVCLTAMLSNNQVLQQVLENAAVSIAGMSKLHLNKTKDIDLRPLTSLAKSSKRFYDGQVKEELQATQVTQKRIAITFLNSTVHAAYSAKKDLEKIGYEVLLFYANGSGGRSMEMMIRDGLIHGVLDLTPREVAAELTSDSINDGSERLRVAGSLGVPQVISLGGLDMIKVDYKKMVLDKYCSRKCVVYEDGSKSFRTSLSECRAIGEEMAHRLNQSCKGSGLARVLLPKYSFGVHSEEGGKLEDREADTELMGALEFCLDQRKIPITKSDSLLNSAEFGLEAAKLLVELMALSS